MNDLEKAIEEFNLRRFGRESYSKRLVNNLEHFLGIKVGVFPLLTFVLALLAFLGVAKDTWHGARVDFFMPGRLLIFANKCDHQNNDHLTDKEIVEFIFFVAYTNTGAEGYNVVSVGESIEISTNRTKVYHSRFFSKSENDSASKISDGETKCGEGRISISGIVVENLGDRRPLVVEAGGEYEGVEAWFKPHIPRCKLGRPECFTRNYITFLEMVESMENAKDNDQKMDVIIVPNLLGVNANPIRCSIDVNKEVVDKFSEVKYISVPCHRENNR